MNESVIFIYICTEHGAMNFVRAQKLGIGGLCQGDGTYQTNWNGLPVIPLGTTDLAGQFHLIAHVVVHTENELVYKDCWKGMISIAAHILHKDHKAILEGFDDGTAPELPKLHTLSRAQHYSELYGCLQKEAVALTKEEQEARAEMGEMDEQAAEAFQEQYARDEELQKKQSKVVPTTEEFADMYEEYEHMDVKEIAKQLAAKPERSMSDGAGYIGKAALAVFTNKDFKALNCAAHISIRSLAPGGSLNLKFKKGDAKKGEVGKFRRDFRITQGRPTNWLKDLYCKVGQLCGCCIFLH